MLIGNMCSIDSNCIFNNSHKNNNNMKANAPEKIWINQSDLPKLSGYIDRNSIEYTRTDAFIEKAAEWLEPVFKNYAGYHCGGELLENFKKAMKL